MDIRALTEAISNINLAVGVLFGLCLILCAVVAVLGLLLEFITWH